MLDDLHDLWRKDRTIVVVVAMTLLLAPSIFIYQTWLGYQQQIDIAEKRTRNGALLLDAEMSAILRRVDGTLLEIVNTIPDEAMHAPLAANRARQVNASLDSHLYAFDELNGLRIVDVNGGILYSSAAATTARANVGDRPYFRQLREGGSGEPVFSDVIFGRTAKRWVIVVARAIRDEQGHFLGAAYAILAVDRIQQQFQSLSLGPESVVELRRSDNNVLLVRWPSAPEAVNQPPSPEQLQLKDISRDATIGLETLRHIDPLDGIERIHSIKPLDDYPWTVHVGLGRVQTLAEWRTRTLQLGAMMVLFLSLVLVAIERFLRMRREERQVLSSLQQSEARLRQLFERNASVMLLLDPVNGRIVDANQAAIAYYGYPAEELTGMNISRITTQPTDDIAAKMKQCRNGHDARFEFRHRLADETLRDVEVYATSLDFAGRSLLYVIIHDITDRRHAETALRQERDRTRMYLDLVETSIVALDRDGRIVSINRKGCQLLGRDKSELIGLDWFSVAHRGEAAATGLIRYRRVVAGEQPLAEYFESAVEGANGQQAQIAWHNARMHDEQGRMVGVLFAGTDITERKRIERELKVYRRSLEQQVAQRIVEFDKLNRRLTLATRAANIGVWEWELTTNQIYWNEQMSAIYGVPHVAVASPEERVRQVHPDDLLSIEDNMKTILASTGPGNSMEFRVVRPDGEIRHLYSTGTVVRDERGSIIRAVGINIDITDRKRVENELREARDTAEASDRAKSEFLANVTHELRTPLNAVIGMTTLATEMSTDARQRDYLNKILVSGKHLNRVINDLLDLTKIAAGHLDIENIPFSPRTVIVRCNSVMAHRAAAKGLELHEIIEDDVPEQMLGDPLRIEQVILNLVGNAIKFTPTGRVEVRIGVVSRETDRVCLEIQVRDSGIGMSEADLARLFKPFSQADATISRRFGGTGLGLAISKRLAELMGGDISVTSVPGAGSVFTLRLTLGLCDPATAQPPIEELLPDAASLVHYHNTHVLVVDDQPLNREIVEVLLQKVGVTVCTAENGQEALYILKKSGPECFDLVLMDIQMPIMDGLTTTRELRRLPGFARLPVIAMTAHTMSHEKDEAMAAGMNDHIGKPFDNVMFFRTLAKWINREKHGLTSSATALPRESASADQTTFAAPSLRREQGVLTDVSGLDRAAGLARFDGKEDRYQHWLAEFAATAGDAVASIRKLANAGNTGEAANGAHALKGRAGMLGMTALHQQLAAVEAALRKGECDAESLASLERNVGEMCAYLGAVCPPDSLSSNATLTLAKLPWNDAFGVGLEALDQQRKVLLGMTNHLADLHAAQLGGEVIEDSAHQAILQLIDHLKLHFDKEENYLRTLAYPDLAEHAKEHAAMLETMAGGSRAKAGEAIDVVTAHQTMMRFFNDHALRSDVRYRRYIDECNLNY